MALPPLVSCVILKQSATFFFHLNCVVKTIFSFNFDGKIRKQSNFKFSHKNDNNSKITHFRTILVSTFLSFLVPNPIRDLIFIFATTSIDMHVYHTSILTLDESCKIFNAEDRIIDREKILRGEQYFRENLRNTIEEPDFGPSISRPLY